MISLLVQRSCNGCIGAGGDIPWFIPSCNIFWRKKTKKKTLIMGRETFEGMSSRQKRSRHIWVISREPNYRPRNAVKYPSFEIAMDECNKYKSRKEYIVCGGAEMYRLFLPHADKFYFCDIVGDYYGDTYFPNLEFDRIKIREIHRVEKTTHIERVLVRTSCKLKLLRVGKAPKHFDPRFIKKWAHHKNVTSRRRFDRNRRREERKIFEFDLFPSPRKIKKYRNPVVNENTEYNLLAEPKKYFYEKKNPVGRPRIKKHYLTPEQRKEIKERLGLNMTIKQLKAIRDSSKS